MTRQPADVIPLRPVRSGPGRGDGERGRHDVLGPLLAVGFAVSAFASGLYDQRPHLLAALGVLGLLVAVVVADGLPTGGPARLAAAGMTALTAWTALSMTWSESVERAWAETDRYVLYAAVLMTSLVLLRRLGSAAHTLAALAVALGVLSLITLARVVTGSADAFFDHRLQAPVDYVNGTAGLLLMALWPTLALAAHHRARPVVSSLAVAAATVEAGLLVLTQSRAVLPAGLVSALVVLVAVPGRLPRLYALLVPLAATVVTLPVTLDVYEQKQTARDRPPTDAVLAHAGLAILGAALGAAVVWALALALRHRRPARHVARAGAVATVALLLVMPLVAFGNPITEVRSQWRDFTALKVDETASSRFTDAGGFRYDLWRIALRDFRDAPLIGLGAGNYGLAYFRQRTTTEPVRQPHSLELQLLAETGLPGLLLLLVLLGGAGWGIVRLVRNGSPQATFVAAAGGGAAVAWLVDTSVDWLHVIPGLTGIAMIAFAALCSGDATPAEGSGRHRTVLVSFALLAAAIAAAGIGRHYAAVVQADQAQEEVASNPTAALRSSATALKLNAYNTDAYVTRAAAFARLGDAVGADATLAQAIAREPGNYVLRALRGDLAARRGRLGDARRFYGQALERNPRDLGLKLLFEHPKSAVTR